MALTPQEKYNKRTEANIASLRPDFGARVLKWLADCRANGLNPYIYFGARSVAEQQVLYDRHIFKKGPLAAPPRKSYHCYGRAIDWVNIKAAAGKNSDLDWTSMPDFLKGVELAKKHKLHSIGAKDIGHLQDGNYASWTSLPKSELIK